MREGAARTVARIAPQHLHGQVHGFQGVRPIASMWSALLSQNPGRDGWNEVTCWPSGSGANLSDRGDATLTIVLQRFTSSGYPVEAG
jgi:hypothetical protein